MGRVISDGGAHVAVVRQSRSVARLSVAVCQRRLRCNRVQKVLSVSSAPSTLLRRSPLPPFSPPLRIRLAPTGGQAPTPSCAVLQSSFTCSASAHHDFAHPCPRIGMKTYSVLPQSVLVLLLWNDAPQSTSLGLPVALPLRFHLLLGIIIVYKAFEPHFNPERQHVNCDVF